MKNLKFVTSKGIEIELSESDMAYIAQHYEAQCTADYLRSEHEDWPEEKVQAIARETRQQMNKYGYDEDDAIEEAISEYEEEKM